MTIDYLKTASILVLISLNGTIMWICNLALQEIDFVIIRCGYTSLTDGTKTKVDPLFEQNIKQCQNLNIPYGVYYYSLATEAAQAKKEAEYVNHLLKDRVPDLGFLLI